MKSSVNIDQFIQEKCRNFSFEWFLKMQDEFKYRPLYSPEKKGIFDELPYFDGDGNTNYIILNIDLNKYCWNNRIAFDSSEKMWENYNELQPCARQAFLEIIDEYKERTKRESNESIYKSIIGNIYPLLNDIFATLKLSSEDSEYLDALDYFHDKAIKSFEHAYYKELDFHQFKETYKQKINFNINQIQLASWLILLIESGIIRDETSFTFLKDFARTHFYFSDNDTGELKPYDRNNRLSTGVKKKEKDIIESTKKLMKKINLGYQKILDEYSTLE